MALSYHRLKGEQFAFRIMKEVRSFVHNGGHLRHARLGLIIALSNICDKSEREILDALLSADDAVDARAPPDNGSDGPRRDKR
jgi:hypothetical protein